MSVNPKLVKELREKTGAGMGACKDALDACSNDIEQAVDWLRKKGLSSASKKADRVTAEGLVCVAKNDNFAALIEVNSETDFVSRNVDFQNFVKTLATLSLDSDGTVEGLKKVAFNEQDNVESALINTISTIGENLSIRRLKKIDTKGCNVFSYVHNSITDGAGKIGVLVVFEGTPKDASLGKGVAMHIAANYPKALSVDDLSKDLVERERSIQRDLALQSGKPAEIVEKMLDGRMSKYYQDVCLLEQSYVMDPDKKVKQVVEESGVKLKEYAYYILGEGIEKEHSDFAEEVAKAMK
jgi:elongation factor Ts